MVITVLGAGSWGTALALLLARNGHEVLLYGRDPDDIAAIRANRENMRYLPGFALPEEITAFPFTEGMKPSDLWVIAVPSSAVRSVSGRILGEHPTVAIAAKGLEAGTSKTLSEVIAEVCPNAMTGVLSGPNLAIELAQGVPTVAVSASKSDEVADRIRDAFMCRTFRIYVSTDVVGVELAGALKNVLAIGAGMSDGLGFGDNTKGALIARGLHEMTRLGIALGATMDTFLGIAGVGDLFATANSKLSRNYRVGFGLGQGRALPEILDELRQVAEGVPTADAASTLARRNQVEAPILQSIYEVLHGHVRPKDAVDMLMQRMPKREEVLTRS